MAKKFNTREIVIADPKKSSIDMSASIKGTGKIGRLIPVFSQEMMPNSTIDYTPNTLARFVPLAAPLMSNMTIRHHIIKIPIRQLYSNWETFITGGEFNTDDSSLDNFTIKNVIELYNKIFTVGADFGSPTKAINTVKNVISGAKNYGFGSIFEQMLGQKVTAFGTPSDWTNDIVNLWNDIVLTLMNMTIGSGSLLDYLGYPVRDWKVLFDKYSTDLNKTPFTFGSVSTTVKAIKAFNPEYFDKVTQFNTTMLRAYYRAWYYYFRDDNLDIVPSGFTPEESKSKSFFKDYYTSNATALFYTFFMLRPVCWAKDLFNTSTLQAYENNAYCPVSDGAGQIELQKTKVYDAKTKTWSDMELPLGTMEQVFSNTAWKENDGLSASNPTITGFSLKNLQKIEALSKYLDRALYGGWTYADSLSNYWGIRYSDARMQLPEYEFGTKQMINCQTLTNNTTTTEQVAGDQAAYAQGITANDGGRIFSEEHAVFIDFMSILPELSYAHSTPTHNIRTKKFDFANPLFAQLGCDVIPSLVVANSLYSSTATTTNLPANLKGFGYADRYYDYKNNVNRLCGKMSDSMKLYTFTQEYQGKGANAGTWVSELIQTPSLSAEYVHCVPSTDCFVSDTNEYEFVFDHQSSIKAQIPLPVVQYV